MTETKTKKTEDRSVKRTKKILRECLFELLECRSIDEITVKELTEKADINRSTFYFYYKDIADMVKQIQNEIFDVFYERVMTEQGAFVTVEDFTEYILRFLCFCKEYESICKFVISNDPANFLSNKIKETLFDHVPDSDKVFPENDPRRYLTCFAVYAMWQTILKWMYDGMKVEPAKMADFLAKAYFFGGRTLIGTDEE